jgi:hypothetical protein
VASLQRSAVVVLGVDRKRRVGQQQESRGILFQEIIFSFSLFSHRENAFRLVQIARRPTCRSEEAGGKTCASWYGLVATGVPVLQRNAIVVLRVDRIGQQQQSRGIIFQEIIFSFSLFSHRANAFHLVWITPRTTRGSEEAGNKTCAS